MSPSVENHAQLVVITAHAGLEMQSVYLTAAHAAAYAACSGRYMSLTRLCGRDAEMTVLVLCKLDN